MFSKISESLIVRSNISSFINYFMLSKLCLGYYFNISKSKLYNTIIRVYCVTFSGLAIAVIVKGYFDQQKSLNPNSLIFASQYIFGITASHFHNQKNFYNFCSTLKAIDPSVGAEKHIKSHVAEFVVLLILLLYTTYFIEAIMELRFNFLFLTYFFCIVSCCLEYVTVTLIIDLLRQRTVLLLKYARKLEDHDVSDDEKLKILKNILFYHKNLLTNLKQNTKFIKPLVGLLNCGLYSEKHIMMMCLSIKIEYIIF